MKSANVLAFARLELAEALRSRWLLFTAVLYLSLVGAFAWLGLRESSVLGFTGLSRVILNLSNAVLVSFPLVVLVGTHAAVVRARTSGFFECFLTQPTTRGDWFAGLLLSRAVVMLGPLVVVLAGVGGAAAVLEPEPGLAAVAARCLGVVVALVSCFMGVGLFVSARARTPERAVVWALGAWVVTAALHDVALVTLMLRVPISPRWVFFLSALNPSEAARIGLLTSVDPELSVLGPVGFWLANQLGSTASLAVAITWPLLLGAVAAWRALANVKTADAVA